MDQAEKLRNVIKLKNQKLPQKARVTQHGSKVMFSPLIIIGQYIIPNVIVIVRIFLCQF